MKVSQSCPTLRPHGLSPARLLCSWDSTGQNTGVGSHSLLRGIFPIQGSNPGLPLFRQILNQLRHQGIATLRSQHVTNRTYSTAWRRTADWKHQRMVAPPTRGDRGCQGYPVRAGLLLGWLLHALWLLVPCHFPEHSLKNELTEFSKY